MRLLSTVQKITPWLLSAVVTILAIAVWGSSLNWDFAGISTYQIFPVLGLLAFSIMWSHYAVGFLRRFWWRDVPLEAFFRYTGYVVLLAIVLHPGLLIYQRFRDGFGLPPHSYETYVAPGMAWLTLLGTVSLLIFLAFELHRWFKQALWWKYVVGAGDLAMLAVFYHSLRLGTQTHIHWFRIIWFIYGITLAVFLFAKYAVILRQRTTH